MNIIEDTFQKQPYWPLFLTVPFTPLNPEDDALPRKRPWLSLSATSNSRGCKGQTVNGNKGGAFGGGFITGTDEGTTVSMLDQYRGSGTGGGAIGKGGAATPGGLDM